jgi:Ca2+-binding EF-hand superfamily protein
MLRRLYRWLIRLHPRCFHHRFADEMLEIFEEVSGLRAVTALFTDAVASLFRQWALRPEFRQSLMVAAVSHEGPGPPYFRTIETYQPRPMALLHGGFISVAVLCAVALVVANSDSRRQLFLIGVHHPSPHLLPLDRASYTENELNTVVTLPPETEDPWRAIASVYFKVVRVLGALDANQDLVISPWEITTAPSALRKLDANHDGKLSPEECGFFLGANSESAWNPQFVKRARLEFMRVNPVLAALDANHDGEISEAEIMNSAAALKTLDTNGDGSLTPDEVIPDKPAIQAAMILFRLDTNNDGRISASERATDEAAPLRQLLESADRNHHGFTTAGELARELRLREEHKRQFESASRKAGVTKGGI